MKHIGAVLSASSHSAHDRVTALVLKAQFSTRRWVQYVLLWKCVGSSQRGEMLELLPLLPMIARVC